MKYYAQSGILLTGAFILFSACDTPGTQKTADLASQQDSVSYSLGFLQGSQMAAMGITDLDMRNFIAGLQQALDEEEAEIDQFEMQMTVQNYMQRVQMEQMELQAAEAESNAEEGRAFLEENAQQEDIIVTESGLQYRVIEEGAGARPSAEDSVEVHYRGTLLDGEEFDSSHSRGETVTFPLNEVIAGWTEGVQLMSEGSTYEFFIPADLAYGNNPPPGSIITPGAVLIFEIELIEVK